MNITTNIVTEKPSQSDTTINDLIEGIYIFSIILIIISIVIGIVGAITICKHYKNENENKNENSDNYHNYLYDSI